MISDITWVFLGIAFVGLFTNASKWKWSWLLLIASCIYFAGYYFFSNDTYMVLYFLACMVVCLYGLARRLDNKDDDDDKYGEYGYKNMERRFDAWVN